jgi:hypothetical protein
LTIVILGSWLRHHCLSSFYLFGLLVNHDDADNNDVDDDWNGLLTREF